MATSAAEALAAAHERREEARRLERRRTALEAELGGRRQERDEAERRLAAKEGELRRLQGLTLERLVASLRGEREERIRRAEADEAAARLRLQSVRSDVAALEAQIAAVEERRRQLGDVEAGYQAALAAREAELERLDAGVAARLRQLDEALNAQRARKRELAEALEAGQGARSALDRARGALESASAWGVWDVAGGGFLATAAKHARLDEARQALDEARAGVRRFRRELADVGGALDVDVNVGGFAAFADYFLDGLFVDLLVQSRIRDSRQRLEAALAAVDDWLRRLRAEEEASDRQLAEAEAERERIVESAG
ncbi:MAG: hypothetical protein QJR08_01215 [Bacillota bacterium]|nr:hypothetical protein [Bacillota bacterium]